MVEFTKKNAEETIRAGAEHATKDQLEEVLRNQREIEEKFKEKGPLGKFIADVKLLFSLVNDYARGNYKEIPWWSIAAVVTALLYVLSPVDAIPDWIPVIGYVDDAMVVGVCLALIDNDLQAYKAWKLTKTN